METFNDVISADRLVLVDFFATWCQPCKMMHPVLEQVKEALGDKVRVIKVDVDKHGQTAAQYGIQGVPTLYWQPSTLSCDRRKTTLPLHHESNITRGEHQPERTARGARAEPAHPAGQRAASPL